MLAIIDPNLRPIADKLIAGQRLSAEDGLTLLCTRDLLGLGSLANVVRERLNGDHAYYIVNRHINHTNICRNRCRFCAFSRSEGEPGAYALSIEEVLRKAEETAEDGVSEFHIVGGLHPTLSFAYYLTMLRRLKERFPQVHLQAFTAVEVDHLARIAGLSIRECLEQLRDAGLGSLPGGGAEVFAPRVRRELCPEKLSADGWLEIMRTAHQLGLKSNATILYGHVETDEELVDHLLRLRKLQDETGGFQAFIPLLFHPRHTGLEGEVPETTTARRDLQVMAASRLMLDNFPHVKVFWIMLGLKLAQVALSFGGDDLDGTVIEERITHSAGAETPECLSEEELLRLIREAGRLPVKRDTLYATQVIS